MNTEARQALKTVGFSTAVVVILVALAWWSMLGLVLVTLDILLGLAVGWHLGYRFGSSRAAQVRRVRPRCARARGQAPRKAK